MYLSRAELDPTRRSTMIALTSPQKFHGAVENSFSGERRRRLWRLDSLNGKLYLLLLSEELPDLTGLCAQFGTGAAPETRRYEPLLERVTPGSCWQFRLTANPTRARKDPADPLARGALKPCYLEAEQEQWLLEQAGKHGFALTEGAFQVTRKQTCHFRKNGKRPVTLLAVTYEGILQVTDPEAFREMLCQGIGRGKAYGLGLMTILHGGSSHGLCAGHFGAAARPRHPCDPPCMPACTGWPMRSLWRWGVRRGWDSCTSGMSALSCTTLPTCTRRR